MVRKTRGPFILSFIVAITLLGMGTSPREVMATSLSLFLMLAQGASPFQWWAFLWLAVMIAVSPQSVEVKALLIVIVAAIIPCGIKYK